MSHYPSLSRRQVVPKRPPRLLAVLTVGVCVGLYTVPARAALTGSEEGRGFTQAEACNSAKHGASISAESNRIAETHNLFVASRVENPKVEIHINDCQCSAPTTNSPEWTCEASWEMHIH
jgi:hypothetical protein